MLRFETAGESHGECLVATLTGLPEEQCAISEFQRITVINISTAAGGAWNGQGEVGIGVNSTTAFSGSFAAPQVNIVEAFSGNFSFLQNIQSTAAHVLQPTIGINTITALENTPVASSTNVNYQGTEGAMLLTTSYRG